MIFLIFLIISILSFPVLSTISEPWWKDWYDDKL